MLSRHDLVWLSGDGWQAARGRALPEQLDAIDRWQREDWPAIARRHDAGVAAGTVCLGMALAPDPADGRKRRIALQVPASAVARSTPPLPLGQALAAAPERWQAGLAALDAQSSRLRAYGSLALQAITRQAYLTASSDIDLLFYPTTVTELRSGLALLEQHAAALPLDGEIVFPSGPAVAWKEWLAAERQQARVLVKELGAVRLATVASLLATLESR
jgi:phosphoribosyl-dephospho-CoA transferase